jgi:ELWxxDGT repeat protein
MNVRDSVTRKISASLAVLLAISLLAGAGCKKRSPAADPLKSTSTAPKDYRARLVAKGLDFRGATYRAGQQVYFWAAAGATIWRLWHSDGTAENTAPVRGAKVLEAFAEDAAPLGDRLIFAARAQGTTSMSIWKSDGTQAGTVPLQQFAPTPDVAVYDFVARSNAVSYVVEKRGVAKELWETDGVTTRQLASEPIGKYATYFVLGDQLYYYYEGEGQIWAVVPGLAPQSAASVPGKITQWIGGMKNGVIAGGKFYFAVEITAGSYQAYVTDGTSGGTAPIAGPGVFAFISLFAPSSRGPVFLVNAGGPVINSNVQLWAVGTSGNAASLLGNYALGEFMNPEIVGNVLLFRRIGAGGKVSLWTSDGTLAGTRLLLNTQSTYNHEGALGRIHGDLALLSIFGSDSSSIVDLRQATAKSVPGVGFAGAYPFVNLGNDLLFVCASRTTAGTGTGSCATDGTVSGTRAIQSPRPDFYPMGFFRATLDTQAFFHGYYTDGTPSELWVASWE